MIRSWRGVFVCMLCIIMLGGCSNKSKVQLPIAKKFMAAIMDGKSEIAWQCTSPVLQRRIPFDSFQKVTRKISENLRPRWPEMSLCSFSVNGIPGIASGRSYTYGIKYENTIDGLSNFITVRFSDNNPDKVSGFDYGFGQPAGN